MAGVLLANAEEARMLTGLRADQAALTLARRYRVVCTKLGRAGAIAASGGDVLRVEVQPVDRADTLGAGDAFAGGFLLSLSRGVDLASALRAGCDTAMAALLGRDRATP
jgi:ribokinase